MAGAKVVSEAPTLIAVGAHILLPDCRNDPFGGKKKRQLLHRPFVVSRDTIVFCESVAIRCGPPHSRSAALIEDTTNSNVPAISPHHIVRRPPHLEGTSDRIARDRERTAMEPTWC